MGQTLVFKCATPNCQYSAELENGIGELWPEDINRIQRNYFDRELLKLYFNNQLSSSMEKVLDEGYQLEDLSKNVLFCEECKTLTSETTWVCKRGNEIVSSKHKCNKCECELKKVEIELNPLEEKLDTDFEAVIKMGKNNFLYKCPECGSERFKFVTVIWWD